MPCMSYATYPQFAQRYSERDLRMVTDPDAQAVQVEVAEQALKDASEEIDFWIGRRYVLPLVLINPATGAGTVSDGAPVLVRCCCDIAMYRLQTLRPADDIKDARQRYEDVLKLLKAMADGDAVLPFRLIRLDAPDTQGAVGMPVFGEPPSLFGRGNR